MLTNVKAFDTMTPTNVITNVKTQFNANGNPTHSEHLAEKSKEKNSKDVYLPFPKNEEKCNVCGLCELSCPDQAIVVEKEED